MSIDNLQRYLATSVPGASVPVDLLKIAENVSGHRGFTQAPYGPPPPPRLFRGGRTKRGGFVGRRGGGQLSNPPPPLSRNCPDLPPRSVCWYIPFVLWSLASSYGILGRYWPQVLPYEQKD